MQSKFNPAQRAQAREQIAATVAKQLVDSSGRPFAAPSQAIVDVASGSNANSPKTVTSLKQLLAEFDLPPDGKLARRNLRAARFGWHSHSQRWELTESQAADVRAVLARVAAGERNSSSKPKAPAMQAADIGLTQAGIATAADFGL